MTKQEIIKELQLFANKHKIFFEEDGEIGFGRKCVGFTSGDNYIAYNPTNNYGNYETIKEFFDEDHYEISAEHSYHKGDYFAVLIADITKNKALIELLKWVKKLEKRKVEIIEYKTGATGMQAMISGVNGKALKIN